MPTVIAGQFTKTFHCASSLTEQTWDALKSNPRNTNVILPIALKCLAREQAGDFAQNHVWITCSSHNPQPTVELILSCTDGEMGAYPIFIVTTCRPEQLTDDFLLPRLIPLVKALHAAVPIHRVYSVFAPEAITNLFVQLWTEVTGVESYIHEPYYAAKLSYCTKKEFVNRQMSVFPDLAFELRPAVEGDLEQVAELCHGFAAESDPFVLTPQAAIREASILIRNNQVWVHRVRCASGQRDEIASIVAFTRNTEAVATISKVYTNPAWRRRGCAERLVRRVCKHLLCAHESVALYVAHNNPGAAKVYHRVGFLGLTEESEPVEGVDRWLEIGLDREKVQLGHW